MEQARKQELGYRMIISLITREIIRTIDDAVKFPENNRTDLVRHEEWGRNMLRLLTSTIIEKEDYDSLLDSDDPREIISFIEDLKKEVVEEAMRIIKTG